ncbi:MAG: response regulator [Bacteroidia bacterium]|nr:response regulator [Bacteroidia bacterium]
MDKEKTHTKSNGQTRNEAENQPEGQNRQLQEATRELLGLNQKLEARVAEGSELLSTAVLRLKTLIQNLQDGILVEDENRFIVVVNQRFCDIFGIPVSPELLLGSDCSESGEQVMHLFCDPRGFLRGIEQLLHDQQLRVNEELELVDGRVFSRDYVPILRDEVYLGHFWRYQDITARKEQQRSLSLVAKFASEAPYGVLRYMESGQRIYGNDLGEAFCEEFSRGDNTEAADHFRQTIEEVYRLGERRTGEIVLGQRWYEVYFVPVQENGYTNVYIIDNSHLKKVERDLVQAREAAEASVKAREMFLANMSHEIRTPMNAIIGMANLLEKSSLDPRQSRYLEVIKNSAENLLVVVNDILDFSKIEAGMLRIAPRSFSLPRLLINLENSLAFKAREMGIPLRMDYDPTIPEVLISDPERLGQILLNLLGNALKFTEEGEVRLSVRRLPRLGSEIRLRFMVSDTGIGIDQAKQAMIFESFEQEDIGTSRRYGGTGLGLAISKQLVELLGGKLGMESTKGVGSKFFFELELPQGKLEKENTFPEKNQATAQLKGVRVLLVEDNLYNRELAAAMLEESGIVMVWAENGRVGLEKLRQEAFDLVLMDIQMPEMGGIEATRIIRQEMGLKIPIIALTANAMEGQKDSYLEAGMDSYLSKPFDPRQLISTILDLVNQSRQRAHPDQVLPSSSLYSTLDLLKQGQGSATFVTRMLKVFCQSTPEIVQNLRASSTHDDFAGACALVHQIKPSVRMLGIRSILPQVDKLGGGAPQVSDHPTWKREVREVAETLEATVAAVQRDFGF